MQSRNAGSWLFVVSLLAIAGCSTGGSRSRRDTGPGGGAVDVWSPVDPSCNASADADGDGIADWREGSMDSDGDGTPNAQDTDSDGDGISDAEESGGGHPCAPRNSDSDTVPDFLDADSDNDGLSDSDERNTYGTNPTNTDTDGDGVTDLGEAVGTGTNPLDPASTIPEDDFFVVLPYLGDRVARRLDFGTNISVADVYFLVDTTGSMGGPITNVQTSLTRIASTLSASIRSVQMGVGDHRDFPFSDGDIWGGGASYGDAGDWAFDHRTDITDNISQVAAGLAAMSAGGGNDGPESQTEALYQTATGEGGSWNFGGSTWSLPARTCPSIPDEIGLRRGYPCFRPGALPIVVLVCDVTWHNGPGGAEGYAGISPLPHTFDQAAEALNAIGARYIGVAVDGGGRAEHEEMARRLGSVGRDGMPLVYDAAGGEVSDAIIEGIGALIGGTPQDVTTNARNVAGNPDGVDAARFIQSIRPQTGCNGTTGTCGPAPGDTYDRQDDTTFYRVIPGTRVTFDVDFYNDFVMPPAAAQIYRARIIVLGNGVAELDARDVYIVVPPEGAGEIII
jgi:hypothetical protein